MILFGEKNITPANIHVLKVKEALEKGVTYVQS